MKPSIVVIVLAVLGCGVYLLYATREAAPPSGTSIAPRARPPSTTAGAAPAAITRLERPTPVVPVDGERAGSTGAQPADDHAGSGSAVTVEEVRDHIQASFIAAPQVAARDVAPNLESGLHAVLPVGSSVRSVDCRGSLCRVETVHRGTDELKEFAHRAFQESPRVTNGPAFISLLEDPVPGRPVVAVIYVGREGTVLPMPDTVAAR
jgi:hypothetical protein